MSDTIQLAIKSALSPEELQEFEIIQNVVNWAYVYFGWTAYDYQVPILRNIIRDAQAVFRLGRRLGKTEIMCILILWYAFTQYNKRPVTNETENIYSILIVAPFEKQIDLIFKRLKQLIEASPAYKDVITRDVKHNITLKNGTDILGITAGSKTGDGANNTRGQHADVIVFDEVDYMKDEDITNIRNIKNEDPERIRIIAASTPSGKRESYYKWCTYASKSFIADVDYIEQTGKIRYVLKRAKGIKPNGWTQYYAPSTVNKNLNKINPDTGQTYLDDLKDELPEYRYDQEVMANFGEELAGVYQKKFIDHAIMTGYNNNCSYANMKPRKVKGMRILGIDWDKFGSETSLLAYEWDAELKLFVPLDKISIPRTKFTLTHAVQTVIKMNEVHKFDWIYVDRGYGEMQVEQLHLYGKSHPESGLHKKVIGVSFSEKVPVRDPYTKKKENKDVKPFMVNTSVNWFEKGIIALDAGDLQLKEQLEQYRVKSISPTGRPTYTSENEHYIDALNLCILGFTLNYDSMIRVQLAKRVGVLTTLDKELISQKGTTLATGLNVEKPREKVIEPVNKGNKNGTVVRTLSTNTFNKSSRSSHSSRTTF